jgi:hypothetical protein
VLAADATVVSADSIVSPLTGRRGAVVVIDVLEGGRPIGAVVLGDLLVLQTDDGRELMLIARRTRLVFFEAGAAPTPLATLPPELVPHVAGSSGGELGYREHVLTQGLRVHVREIDPPEVHEVLA